MYPEHEKLKNLDRECEGARRVFDWLESQGYFIAEYTGSSESSDWCVQVHVPFSTIIGNALGIDEEVLEAEKREMMDAIRNTRLGPPR
jgi:hypothetical protein